MRNSKPQTIFFELLVIALAVLAGSLSFAATSPSRLKKPVAKASVVHRPAKVSKPAHVASVAAVLNTPIKSHRASDDLKWAKAAPTWFRTVRAIDAETLSTLAEVQAAVIDSRFLAVPWSFISQVWLARTPTRFIVMENRQEARLLEVDVLSNVALLKADQALGVSLSRSSLRLDIPPAGEPLLTFASKEALRPGARFVRAQVDASMVRYWIDSSSQEKSQWAYHFDRSGKLVSIASSNEGIGAASARSLYELLRHQDGPRPASVDTAEIKRRQVAYWQDHQAQILSPSRNSVVLRGLDCKLHLASINDRSLATEVQNIRSQTCETASSLELGAGYKTGAQVVTNEVTFRGQASGARDHLSQALAETAFTEQEKATSVVNLLTPPDCQENIVQNLNRDSVSVRFCTAALKLEPSLGDTVFSVSALDPSGRAFVTVVRLKGFNQSNTKRILEAVIENARRLR